MKLRGLAVFFMTCILALQGIGVHAYDTSTDSIREKQLQFASRYEYHAGDFDKSFELYPGIAYTSGIEYAEDGTSYECPAIYVDAHADFVDSYNLKRGEAKFILNGMTNQYTGQCILYNSRLLVPVKVFEEVGCGLEFNESLYVAKLSKADTILEILPNLIGMRKNQENGFWVPLEVCARFVDDTLYVPVRAVANEFGLSVNWDNDTYTVTLDSNE